MGKNQTHKAMQRAKAASRRPGGAPGEEGESNDGMVDGSFHSPEWHAARLASLQTTHTVTWEEWKAQRKEELRKQEEEEGFEERRMREYREQLDREREDRLAQGRNHADKKEKLKKKEKKDKGKDKDKDKDKGKKSSKKKKRKGSGSEGAEDGSGADSPSGKGSKKARKEKQHDSGDDLSSASEEGPMRLSSFFKGGDGDLSADSEDERGKGYRAQRDPFSKAMEEARRRAEIGAHMVKEVKRAEETGTKRRW